MNVINWLSDSVTYDLITVRRSGSRRTGTVPTHALWVWPLFFL